ncbi:MAG: ABC transporter permease subunit [Oscillospiraceae bacterium]|nr:ABC transporter permease subunit [Oscillospiraceae bacterium]
MKASLRKPLAALGVLVFWIGLWFLAAGLVGKELLLPSPLQVLRRLGELAALPSYWSAVGFSILRVLTGIAAATLLGILLALLTEGSPLFRALLSPMMTVIKSTPVASFIILALLWLGRAVLPAFISGLMVLPIVWSNVSAGIAARDPLLLEMGRVYGFSRGKVFRLITVPTALPYLRSALRSALGLGWKAGIAAEVLTVPANSVGKMIFESKLYLETTSLFAWTLTVILLSLLLERLMLAALRRTGKRGGEAHA